MSEIINVTQPLLLEKHFVRVIGIGNTLAGDDGLGVHAVRYLEASMAQDSGIDFVDGGTLGLYLLDDIVEAPAVILIDALRFQSEPGSVCVFEGDAMDNLIQNPCRRTSHEVGLSDLLAVVRLLDGLPAHRAIIGIEPSRCGWCGDLSKEAAAALPVVAQKIEEVLMRWDLAVVGSEPGTVSGQAR